MIRSEIVLEETQKDLLDTLAFIQSKKKKKRITRASLIRESIDYWLKNVGKNDLSDSELILLNPTLMEDILAKVEKIIEDPELHTRETLQGKSGTRKLNLTGLRSAAVRDKYRIIFILCKDCKELHLKENGIFFCEMCEEENNSLTIKFLAFGSHDDAYFMK